MATHLTISFFVVLWGIAGSKGFTYEDPNREWREEYPTCNGNNQSPVNIPMNIRKVKEEDKRLVWKHYDNPPDSMQIVNNGYTIQVNPVWVDDSERPYLSKGPLNGEYVMEQLNFHWGQNDSVGSEHLLNGRSGALELHMVHWKRDYGSLQEAIKHTDGVAIFATFYTVNGEETSNGIKRIWSVLEYLRQENHERQVEPFKMTDFPGVNGTHLYASYYGSFTTPECNEAVTWIVWFYQNSISKEELEEIRAIELAHGDDHNNRPVQEFGDRHFTFYLTGFNEEIEPPDEESREEYPTCNGNNLSLVNIPIDPFKTTAEDERLVWKQYDNPPDSMEIVNNDYTIQVNPVWSRDSDRPYLRKGPFNGEYIMEQFHFYWGQNDSVGSQHTVNGESGALELHMVHWKRDYGSLEEAKKYADGVAIFATLYTVNGEETSNGIKQIWSALETLRQENHKEQVEPFKLTDFPEVNGTSLYASYYGSSTTPGYNKAVTWLVSLRHNGISEQELKEIRAIKLAHGDDPINRPIQECGDRDFTYYLTRSSIEIGHFTYDAPNEEWGKKYPMCDGNNQSPINIPFDIHKMIPRVSPKRLKWNQYDNSPDSMEIVNNGHTIQINPVWSSDSDRPYLSGGPLDGEYVMEQIQFHWGQNNHRGSEHTLNGNSGVMELHMIHWKRDYGSFPEALMNEDGVAVVASQYWIERIIHGVRVPLNESSNGIKQIWSVLDDVQQENTKSQVKPFRLTDFSDVNNQNYYISYFGSLTSPGCNEVVTWLVSVEQYGISKREMKKIRTMHLTEDDNHNNRPVQKLGKRELTFYKTGA